MSALGWGLVALLAGPPADPADAAAAPPADPGVGAPVDPPATAQPVPAGETPVAVTTRLEPDPSNVGDLLTLEVVAAFPRNVSVNLPTGLELPGLHVVSVEASDPESTGTGLRKTFTVVLQHFDVGEGTIPSFPLTWVDAEGGVHTQPVPARTFTVESLLANEADPEPAPDDPPRSIAYPNTVAETVIYSALATLVLGLVAWLVGRRLWGRRRVEPLPPPTPAHEVALEALTRLEREDLVGEGRFTDHYLQLTEITKAYLEGRFGVEALDRTTEEIRRALVANGHRIDPLDPDEVIRFLQQADLVKFARFPPEDDEARGATGEVRSMVIRTRPRTEVTPGPSVTGDPSAAASADPPPADAGGAATKAPAAPSPDPAAAPASAPEAPQPPEDHP